MAQLVVNLSASAGDTGDKDSVPALGRSPGEGNGSSRQYSCLKDSMDRGAWRATVHGVTTEHMHSAHTMRSKSSSASSQDTRSHYIIQDSSEDVSALQRWV